MNENLPNTSPKLARDEKGRLLPGQPSLNPTGKKRGTRNMTSILRTVIERVADDKGTPHDVMLIRMALKRAEMGDFDYFRYIYERLEGKIPDKIDLTSKGEGLAPSPESIALANAALLQYLKSNAKPSDSTGDIPK